MKILRWRNPDDFECFVSPFVFSEMAQSRSQLFSAVKSSGTLHLCPYAPLRISGFPLNKYEEKNGDMGLFQICSGGLAGERRSAQALNARRKYREVGKAQILTKIGSKRQGVKPDRPIRRRFPGPCRKSVINRVALA